MKQGRPRAGWEQPSGNGIPNNQDAPVLFPEGHAAVGQIRVQRPVLPLQVERVGGIAVLRLPSNTSETDLTNLILTLARALTGDSIAGKLWIVESGRVRVYQESELQQTAAL